MLEWLPRLSGPDVVIVLLTIGLCLSASRVGQVGDAFGRLFGAGRSTPSADPPSASPSAPPDRP